MKHIIAIAILGSLVLLSGCGDQLPTDIPESYGYQGFLDHGWDSYAEQDFEQALEYFEDAIECNVSGVEGYVGAGWSSLFISDMWRIADNYFYMAIQLDAGTFPMLDVSESQTQDTMWTVFECLHEDLPPSVLDPILELTADSGLVWVSDSIVAIIGASPIPYRFQPDQSHPMAMFEVSNGYSAYVCDVDSIVDEYVYMNARVTVMEISGEDYYVWINADNQMNYDYRNFDASGSETQYTLDALAGFCMLQDIRGENGDPLLGCASAWGLGELAASYSFGSGKDYSGLEVITNVHIKGTAAAIAFAYEAFRFSWFTCLSEGYGTTLNPLDEGFVLELMAVIENMLNS